jgi:hypothetical protein
MRAGPLRDITSYPHLVLRHSPGCLVAAAGATMVRSGLSPADLSISSPTRGLLRSLWQVTARAEAVCRSSVAFGCTPASWNTSSTSHPAGTRRLRISQHRRSERCAAVLLSPSFWRRHCASVLCVRERRRTIRVQARRGALALATSRAHHCRSKGCLTTTLKKFLAKSRQLSSEGRC